MPEIVKHESTLKSFNRLTQNAPWTPFKEPDKGPFTDIDKAEHALFDDLSKEYDRNATRLDSTKGYKTFVKAWDLELAARYTRKLEGEDVTLINRKSYIQLQQHFDNVARHKELLKLASQQDEGDVQMEREFRITRRLMRPHQEAIACQAIQCQPQLGVPQFGVPMALNNEVTGAAFRRNMVANPPFLYRPIRAERNNAIT